MQSSARVLAIALANTKLMEYAPTAVVVGSCAALLDVCTKFCVNQRIAIVSTSGNHSDM